MSIPFKSSRKCLLCQGRSFIWCIVPAFNLAIPHQTETLNLAIQIVSLVSKSFVATKKSSVAAQNKKEESQATSGSKKRSSSIEEEEISTQKKAKIDKIMHSVDAKKAKTNDSKVSNDNETRDDFEEGITKDSSLAENSCQVGIKLSMAGSKKEDKSEKDHSEVSKNKLEKEHDSRNTAGPAATSHNASNDAKRTKKLPKCPYGNSCYR